MVIAPALWIGGVFPSTVLASLCLGVAAVGCVGFFRHRRGVRVPASAILAGAACLLTAVQWVPWSTGFRQAVAPRLASTVERAVGTATDVWAGLTTSPGDTGLEVGRLFALLLLTVAAANFSWRLSAAAVAVCSSVVVLIGLFHHAFDMHAIYGVYQAVDIDPSQTASLLTSFVNPNHQSGLMLLGLFCAAGLAVDVRAQTRSARDSMTHARRRELHLMCMSAIALLVVGLVLSRSRGAMLAGAIVTPLALWWAWMPTNKGRAGERSQLLTRGLVVAASVVAVVALVRAGAWDEVLSLGHDGDPTQKLRLAWSAMPLTEWSPVLGTGRGTFIDLFPLVNPATGSLVHTHLESVPLTMRVEWGLFGIAIGGGLLAWWLGAVFGTKKRRSSQARRVVLCGLLALAIQNVGDFSVEFLGVAAPAAALVGGLSPRTWRVRRRVWIPVLALSFPLVFGIAATSAPYSWTARDSVVEAVANDALPATQALRMLPLSSRLHASVARRYAERGAWDAALPRARAATMLRPGSADVWFLRAAVEDAVEPDASAGREALGRALAKLERPLAPAHLMYLQERYPDPLALVPLMAQDRVAWLRTAGPMIEQNPDYAAVLIAARAADDRHPRVLEQQVEVALRQGNAALALHAARLLREQQPQRAAAHLLVVRALRSFEFERERDIQQALQRALREVDDAAGRGQLEEALIRSWMATGERGDLERASELTEPMMSRPADRATLQRRHTLSRSLAAALEAMNTPQ